MRLAGPPNRMSWLAAARPRCPDTSRLYPAGGTNGWLGPAKRVGEPAGGGGGVSAWLGARTATGAGVGGGAAAATLVACSGGVQPAGGTNALLGSAERAGGTTGAGCGTI